MDNATCSVEGCNRQHRAHSPLRSVPRFEASIRQNEAGCWLWTAKVGKDGYGWFFAGGHDHVAHRWSYEYHRAEIPKGLVIDHLCRNRACVNPWHLEPVTTAVNNLRGLGPRATQTHCKRGHEFTPENTVIQKAGRCCRTCRNAGSRRARTAASS